MGRAGTVVRYLIDEMLLEFPGAFFCAHLINLPHGAVRVNPRNNGGDHPGHSKSTRLLRPSISGILCIRTTGTKSHVVSTKVPTRPYLGLRLPGGQATDVERGDEDVYAEFSVARVLARARCAQCGCARFGCARCDGRLGLLFWFERLLSRTITDDER